MSTTTNDVSDGVCVVCFKPIEIFSIGDCDHPVCFECSTRMRVLCLQTECPICRHDISKVIFTPKVEPYKNVLSKVNMNSKKNLYDEKYKILFADASMKEAYLKLLQHYCNKCGATFKTFAFLKDHMNKEHQLFFCDLCVDNLKIFTSERKFYTRQQHAFHRRKGDPDDTSHKGHPLCEFCDTRYMDTDELFRHLRKDHLYCHICDADGFHQYYVSFHTLRDHFRKDHYLCEEGDCCSEGNMTVFRTEIDFKAHKASEHGRGLSKQAARQARTLELQFTLTPRPMPARVHRNEGENARTENIREAPSEVSQVVESVPVVDMDSIKQFPTLGDSGATSVMAVALSRQDKPVIRQTTGALARTDENFPALSSDALPAPGPGPSTSFRLNISHPGPSSAVIRTNVKPNMRIQVHNQSQPSTSTSKQSESEVWNKLDENNQKVLDEFPRLSKKDRKFLMNDYTSYSASPSTTIKKVAGNEVSSVSSKRQSTAPPPPSLDAFPALHPSGTIHVVPTQPQWIAKVKTKESKPKQNKANLESVVPPKPVINDITQFPAPPLTSASVPWLSREKCDKNSKVSDSVDMAQPQWVTLKQKEPSTKATKVAPAPTIPSQPLNISDFPSLKSKQKKKQLREVETDLNDNSVIVSNKKGKSKNISESSQNSDNCGKSKLRPTSNKENDKSTKYIKKKSNNNSSKSCPERQHQESDVHTHNPGNGNGTASATSESTLLMPKRLPNFNPPNPHVITPTCNGFTFTSSLGQNYNIPAHNYIQPMNFNERNKALVTKFMEVLGEADAIHQFKLYSQLFREGRYSAECYYNHCIESMKQGFSEMFPELLVLLPDIRKQQELHKVHLLSNGSGSHLYVCNVCGQVLITIDVQFHKDFHTMQSAFPALGLPPSAIGTSKQK